MLGFDVSERTISRWMRRAPRDPEPARRWLAFLPNHQEVIRRWTSSPFQQSRSGCSTAFSSSPMIVLHFNVTKHPTSTWIVPPLREALPFESAPRFLIFDRDSKYGLEILAAVRSLKMSPVRTSFESPWQNGVAERSIGSCRRDLLDHIIATPVRSFGCVDRLRLTSRARVPAGH